MAQFLIISTTKQKFRHTYEGVLIHYFMENIPTPKKGTFYHLYILFIVFTPTGESKFICYTNFSHHKTEIHILRMSKKLAIENSKQNSNDLTVI